MDTWKQTSSSIHRTFVDIIVISLLGRSSEANRSLLVFIIVSLPSHDKSSCTMCSFSPIIVVAQTGALADKKCLSPFHGVACPFETSAVRARLGTRNFDIPIATIGHMMRHVMGLLKTSLRKESFNLFSEFKIYDMGQSIQICSAPR